MLQTVAILYGHGSMRVRSSRESDYELLECMLVAGVKQGVWLHEQIERREDCRLNLRPARLTALQRVIRSAWESCSLDACGEPEVVQSLRQFVTALCTAGVDLAAYGAYESELGGVFHAKAERFQHGRVLYGFTYGSRPSDWSVLVEHPGDQFAGMFWSTIEHPERSMPGAWYEEPTPCWEDFYFNDLKRQRRDRHWRYQCRLRDAVKRPMSQIPSR